MAITPYNGDIKQSLKWMHNNAPKIQSLVQQKADWYSKYNDTFWKSFFDSTFNIKTATPFGLLIWCFILGVPSQIFGLYPESDGWAFGSQRQNFKWNSTTSPSLPNPNTRGGNFFGGGSTTILNIDDVRHCLMLRYVALVSNGSIKWINKMLNVIFNDSNPWDYANGRYFYLADASIVANQQSGSVHGVTDDMYMEYRVGSAMNISSQFISLMNDPKYGLIPSCAGVKYQVIQE
jgi:hypothetical protein